MRTIERSLRGVMKHRVSIMRRTPGTTDEYGNEAGVWEEVEEAVAYVSNMAPNENRDRQETMTSRYTVIVPPDVDVRHSDRIIWRDWVMEVETVEFIFHPLYALPHHIRARTIVSSP